MKAVGKRFNLILTFIGFSSPINLLTSCSNSQAIQFANFESYMDSDLMLDLENKYDIQFPHYTVTENIETKFKKYYDMAIPSCYEMFILLKNGWLEEIDWAKLTDNTITNAEAAKELFEPNIINKINNQFNNLVFQTDEGAEYRHFFPEGQVNVLKYGVPYFAQSFVFAYKSQDEIQFYKYGTTQPIANPNWADIFYTVAKNDYFAPKKGHWVGMVDDSKSIYDVARIAETTLAGETPTNKVPDASSKNRMIQTYSTLTDCFASQPSKFILNSDSGTISKLFADPNSSTAAFTWSGDTIYAAKGAEEYEPVIDQFHVQPVSSASLDEVEFVVINNKNKQDTFKSKRDSIYNIIKQVCLEGCNANDIGAYDQTNQRYKYWTMQNFDALNYTPLLKTVYNEVMEKTSPYWRHEQDPQIAVEKYISILSQVTREDVTYHLFGRPTTDQQNSDIHWAWLDARGKF